MASTNLKRVYKLSNSNGVIVFNNVNYILSSLDLGSSEQELSTLNKKVGSVICSTRQTERSITMLGYATSGGATPNRSTLEANKALLQSICRPDATVKLTVSEFKNSVLTDMYSIDCIIENTVEWLNDQYIKTGMVNTFRLHLKAPYPYFSYSMSSAYNSQTCYTASSDSPVTVATYNKSTGVLTYNNIGEVDNIPISFQYKNGSASSITLQKVVIGSTPSLVLSGSIALVPNMPHTIDLKNFQFDGLEVNWEETTGVPKLLTGNNTVPIKFYVSGTASTLCDVSMLQAPERTGV